MSLPHLWHQLEGQSAQRLGSCRCQFPYNIHNTQTMRTALEDGQIPKDIFNDQLALGKRPQAHPQLRYKDICERDMKVLDINTEIWEDTAATAGAACSRRCWRQVRRRSWSWTWQREESQAEGTQTRQTPPPLPLTSNYVCTLCSRDYHSRIGLTRHRQCCSSHNTTTSSAAVSMVDIDRRRSITGHFKDKTKALKGSMKPILISFGIFLVFKLARTYHKLDKYAKKIFLVTGTLVLVTTSGEITKN